MLYLGGLVFATVLFQASSAQNVLPAIVGGNTASLLKWRWQVRLIIYGRSATYTCGGIFVHQQYILTARHCVCHSSGQVYGSETCSNPIASHPSLIYAIVGDYNKNRYESSEYWVRVSQFWVDPRLHDAAVLRLQNPVTPSSRRQIISLGCSTPSFGSKVWTTGWGVANPYTQQTASYLQEIELTTMSSCFDSKLICANKPGSSIYRNICFGDSGGPLVQKQRASESEYVWRVVGITSVTVNSNRCKYQSGFGGFTSVPRICSWINSKINLRSSRECYTYSTSDYTLDRTYHNFAGSCEHVMTAPCTSLSSSLGVPNFKVFAQKQKYMFSWGSARGPYLTQYSTSSLNSYAYGYWPAYPKMIGIKVGSNQITLETASFVSNFIIAKVNGRRQYYFPRTVDFGSWWADIVKDPINRYRVSVETSFGLTIYLGPYYRSGVHINNWLATATRYNLCGTCGKHNHYSSNLDFTTASGRQYNRIRHSVGYWYHLPKEWYSNYVTPNKPSGCVLDPRIDIIDCGPSCSLRKKRAAQVTNETNPTSCKGKKLRKAQKFCSIINDAEGPFGACNGTDLQEDAYEDCLFEYCSAERSRKKQRCLFLETYADKCKQHGELGDWREKSRCEMKCNRGRVYSMKASLDCVPTCYEPEPCGEDGIPPDGVYQEGCVCPAEHVWNGKKCVPKTTCKSMTQSAAASVKTSSRDCSKKKTERKRLRCLARQNANNGVCSGLSGRKRYRCIKEVIGTKLNKGKKDTGSVPRREDGNPKPLHKKKRKRNHRNKKKGRRNRKNKKN